jgi:hypothetical protein
MRAALVALLAFPLTALAGAPAGWHTVSVCAVDTSARILKDYSVNLLNLTPQSCASACAKKGYSYAGVEYTNEVSVAVAVIGTPYNAC